MQPHLIFGLCANIAAMGELAGHERRGSLLWPARSALIGLMGAALGLRREDDFSRLEALEIAVAIFNVGTSLRDYHTVQTVPSTAVKAPNSRPQALVQAGPLRTNTTITYRDYRCGVFYGVAVQGEGLDTLAAALRRPQFTLYLGRKSCPLSAPTGAKVVTATDCELALSQLTPPPWLQGARAEVLITQGEGGAVIHDQAIDRGRWHFAPRQVLQTAADIRLGGIL